MFGKLVLLAVTFIAFHWLCRFVSRSFRLAAGDIKARAILITGCDSGTRKHFKQRFDLFSRLATVKFANVLDSDVSVCVSTSLRQAFVVLFGLFV